MTTTDDVRDTADELRALILELNPTVPVAQTASTNTTRILPARFVAIVTQENGWA